MFTKAKLTHYHHLPPRSGRYRVTHHYDVWMHHFVARQQEVSAHWSPANFAVVNPAYLAQHPKRAILLKHQKALDELDAKGLITTDAASYPLDEPFFTMCRPDAVSPEWIKEDIWSMRIASPSLSPRRRSRDTAEQLHVGVVILCNRAGLLHFCSLS